LQHGVARLGQRPHLQRSHAAGLVHFFGKGMEVEHQAAGHTAVLAPRRRVKQAKPLAASSQFVRQEKGLWLHRYGLSGSQLAGDKVGKRANGGKG